MRVAFWTLASYVFYAFAGPWFVTLLLASTLVDFVVARRIHGSTDERERRILLVLSISFGLGLLAFFKYFGFFVDTVSRTMAPLHAMLGVPALATPSILRIALPAGISFYTFMTISYTVDVYRRDLEPEKDFWYFAGFVALFPHLIAGPVLRARDILPQLHALPARHRWRLQEGLFLFAVGLVKKVLIADRIGTHVDLVLENFSTASTATVWLAMVGYALQIYFDFSAYSDMARGLGWLLGLDFVVNFDSPYRALDPADFWRRWHISLSTWFRDYLYIPVGGNRWGVSRRYRNLMVTMVLGGLWHGAGWNFALWGALHGVALVLYRRFQQSWDRLPVLLRWSCMFMFVVLTWVPFRLRNLGEIVGCYRLMFSLEGIAWPSPRFLLYLGVGMVLAAVVRRNSNDLPWSSLRPVTAAALGLLTAYAIFHLNESNRFLYFQF